MKKILQQCFDFDRKKEKEKEVTRDDTRCFELQVFLVRKLAHMYVSITVSKKIVTTFFLPRVK